MITVAMVTEQQTSRPASDLSWKTMELLLGTVVLLTAGVVTGKYSCDYNIVYSHPIIEGRVICHHDSYNMRGQYCYRYVLATATYSQATRRCERDGWGSSLLYITSAEEDG